MSGVISGVPDVSVGQVLGSVLGSLRLKVSTQDVQAYRAPRGSH